MWYTRSTMWAFMICSGYNLMFLTLERCWAITRPFKYNQDAVVKRFPFICMFCWVISFASVTPNSVFNRMVGDSCSPFYHVSKDGMRLIAVHMLAVGCFIPGGVMIVSYVLIWFSLKRSQTFQNSDSTNSSTKLRMAQMNLLQTCVILVVMFVLCWINHAIRFILINGNYFLHLRTTYYPSTLFFIILNSCLNPFVYCVRYKEFQNQVRQLFHIKKSNFPQTSIETETSKS